MNLDNGRKRRVVELGLAICLVATLTGCRPFDLYTKSLQTPLSSQFEAPTELNLVSLPDYRIENPDVLQLEVLKLIPKPPFRIDVYDVLEIKALNDLPDFPLDGYYVVDESGNLELGSAYGKVHVQGLTLDEAKPSILKKLHEVLTQPEISVRLARTGGTQQINGVYLVQPNGVINLKQFGSVHVAGKTLLETQIAIENQLTQFFDSPRMAVNVAGFNSKKYYIVFEGSGEGEDVISLPITGKETVLDAISTVGGLKKASSKDIWIARPAPGNFGCEQVLPVDYMAITRGGSTTTNYQLMPGDRLFVAEDAEIASNNYFTRVSSPVYQLLGLGQLGAESTRAFQSTGRFYNRARRF